MCVCRVCFLFFSFLPSPFVFSLLPLVSAMAGPACPAWAACASFHKEKTKKAHEGRQRIERRGERNIGENNAHKWGMVKLVVHLCKAVKIDTNATTHSRSCSCHYFNALRWKKKKFNRMNVNDYLQSSPSISIVFVFLSIFTGC